ncbi:glycerophosphodiester phosphodiesterase [Vagococcus carniphilus]|uniref:glycerophosphodiester phosphodiesterase n=1 Tax=Vagococcus carniphilus TaxID=218144 RepID=UPI00288F40D4|nr:glycerophosphodiester phosphodiesterase [Vagococcus carniphilus]MDT2848273.1 glycerophosphodiester phosphodiesterase [Vagococcus carniphilus]
MSTFSLFKKITKEFFSHCLNYLTLFFSMNVMLFAVITLFDYAASLILRSQHIPYLSYTNLIVLVQKPMAILLLLLLFILLIMSVYFQFSYLLLGIQQIYRRQFNLIGLLKESLQEIRRQTWRSLSFFFFYFILVLPVSQEIFQTQLLNKVVIPNFIIDFLGNNLLYALLLALAGTVIVYLAIRWLFVLPLVILTQISPKEAIPKSLEITKGKFWFFSWRIFLLSLFSVGIKYMLFILIYFIQIGLDTLSQPYSLIGGIFNLSLVQVINVIGGAWTSILLMSLLMYQPVILNHVKKKEWRDSNVSVRWLNLLNGFILVMISLSLLLFNGLFLNGLTQREPKVISHRGVDSLMHPNGVQNTIPSLKETIKLKPDFIEMDIQETKDGKFVMMHDPDLSALTGNKGTPQSYTLEELTQMTVHENGMSAKVASFDEYLEVANKANQKLLIEIKTSKQDSKKMMANFIKTYEKDILAHHHEVQSLDYHVISTLKEQAPKIPVSYILPYNFVFPNTPSDGYTMEATTLNETFIIKARGTKKHVFAWTVNETDDMNKMMFMDVDGIITDELSLLKQEIKEFRDSPNYADRIMYYISVLPN